MKAASAVLAAGYAGLSYSELAAILAGIYTSLLIGEWVWKKVLRPVLEHFGVMKKKRVYIAYESSDQIPLEEQLRADYSFLRAKVPKKDKEMV
jgi:hypothetical protein